MDTKKLRQKILDLAIHGKLVPQDPNDEPASVLLERIRAEKEQLIKEGKIKAPKKSKTAGDTSHYGKDMPFEIPNGWEWCRINDISDSILYGVSESAKANGKYKLLRITDIQNSEVNWSSVPMTDFDESKADQYILNNNDILFARTGATVGKSYLAQNTPNNAIYASYLIRIRISHFLSPQFVKYYFESEYYWEQINVNSVGVGQPNVNGTILGSLSIPLPPRKEQERIVEIVSKMLITMDSLLSEQNLIVKSVEKTKEKILDLAIHGKLVPQDSAEEPAIESLRRFTPSFACSDNLHYVGELPKGWQLCHIQDIAKVELGKTLDRIKNSGSEVPYLCALNVKWDGIDLSTLKTLRLEDAEKKRYRLLPNDLLVCEGGDVGRCAIWRESVEMYYQNALHRVRFYDRILPEFFLFVLRFYKDAGVIDDICKGVTIKHFTGQVFRTLDLPFPPINEQKRIVDKVNCLFNSIDLIADMINAS